MRLSRSRLPGHYERGRPVRTDDAEGRECRIQRVNNGFIISVGITEEEAEAGHISPMYVERSTEQLCDRIRQLWPEPSAPQDGG